MPKFTVRGHNKSGETSLEFEANSLEHLAEVVSKSHNNHHVEIVGSSIRIVMFSGQVIAQPTPEQVAMQQLIEAVDSIAEHVRQFGGQSPVLIDRVNKLKHARLALVDSEDPLSREYFYPKKLKEPA
jgi:hypothetical protein